MDYRFRESPIFFLGVAAAFDALLDASYIFLMTISVLYEHLTSVRLLTLWHSYVRGMNAVSQTSMTASSFLLVAATWERYRLVMYWTFQGFSSRTRYLVVSFALTLAVLLKSTTYFELQVIYLPQCAIVHPLAQFTLYPSCLAMIPAYGTFFKFWVRKITTIICPFVLLCYFNLAIILKLQRPTRRSNVDLQSAMLSVAYGRATIRQHKEQVNRATRTMLIVATAYLLTHVLNFFLATWELVDKQSLFTHYFTFYSFGADACSILAVLGNVVRFPIYMTSDHEIRTALTQLFARCFAFCLCSKPRRAPKLSRDDDDAVSLPLQSAQPEWTAGNGHAPPWDFSHGHDFHFTKDTQAEPLRL